MTREIQRALFYCFNFSCFKNGNVQSNRLPGSAAGAVAQDSCVPGPRRDAPAVSGKHELARRGEHTVVYPREHLGAAGRPLARLEPKSFPPREILH